MRVTFNELAERELNDAAEYYELERPGLGSVFIAEVQRCTEGIVAHPQAAPAVRGEIRRRLCERFPYGLLYTVRSDEIRDSGRDAPSAPTWLLGRPEIGRPNKRLQPAAAGAILSRRG